MSRTNKVGSHKTKVRTVDGRFSVRYHNTDVVVVEHGIIVLDSGGWQTVTTKRRMNQASHEYGLGYSVFQKKHEWFVAWRGKNIPFYDGIMFDRSEP